MGDVMLPEKVRRAVWNKTDGVCWYCGGQTEWDDDFSVDHIVPSSSGGSDDIENLVPCCMGCNRKKHAHDLEGFREVMGRPSHYRSFSLGQKRWLLKHYGIDIDRDLAGERYIFWFEKNGLRP